MFEQVIATSGGIYINVWASPTIYYYYY